MQVKIKFLQRWTEQFQSLGPEGKRDKFEVLAPELPHDCCCASEHAVPEPNPTLCARTCGACALGKRRTWFVSYPMTVSLQGVSGACVVTGDCGLRFSREARRQRIHGRGRHGYFPCLCWLAVGMFAVTHECLSVVQQAELLARKCATGSCPMLPCTVQRRCCVSCCGDWIGTPCCRQQSSREKET